jgi:hypothetical protein
LNHDKEFLTWEVAMSYELVDAEALSKRCPCLYEIPPLAERKDLSDHCWVELGFRSLDGTIERMLVQVEERETDADTYYGVLGQVPIKPSKVTIGAQIQFAPKNIFGIVAGE